MATNLPINIDTTYSDDPNDASRKTHQQHHDAIHAYTNGHDGAVDPHGDRAYTDAAIDSATSWAGAMASLPSGSPQPIPHNTQATITFTTEDYDSDGLVDLATQPTRITVPAGMGGLWLVRASASFEANGTGYRTCRIAKNGSFLDVTVLPSQGSLTHVHQAAFLAVLAAGDYLELTVQQTSGGPLNGWGNLQVAYLGAS